MQQARFGPRAVVCLLFPTGKGDKERVKEHLLLKLLQPEVSHITSKYAYVPA